MLNPGVRFPPLLSVYYDTNESESRPKSRITSQLVSVVVAVYCRHVEYQVTRTSKVEARSRTVFLIGEGRLLKG